MKKHILLIIVLPLFCTAQWNQSGQTIEGEAVNDRFGCSVSLNNAGNIMAIGANGHNGNKGHVRVFENIAGTWTQIGQDIDGQTSTDSSGASISLNAIGNIIAIGAASNAEIITLGGEVRVYENIEGNWIQIGEDLKGFLNQGRFGKSVSINDTGTMVAIGAEGNGVNGINSGLVQVYENNSGSWVQIGQNLDGEEIGDFFGVRVNLNSSGSILAVGASGNDDSGLSSGNVRVFENVSGTWIQLGGNLSGEAPGDLSGKSFSLNSQGNVIAIGAAGNNENGDGSGNVRVFEYSSSTWTQLGQDIYGENPGDVSGGGYFASSVILNAAGNIVAIGAVGHSINGTESGQVRVFEYDLDSWNKIDEDIYGAAEGDRFGDAISLNSTGNIMAIGAFGNDTNGMNSGQIRVFKTNTILNIEDDNFINHISIFPNPTSGLTKIQLSKYHNELQVDIFNSLGNLIRQKTYINTDQITLDTKKFNSGLYFVKIKSNTSQATLKLITK